MAARHPGRQQVDASPSARRRPLSSCLITVSKNILLLWKVFKLYVSIKYFICRDSTRLIYAPVKLSYIEVFMKGPGVIVMVPNGSLGAMIRDE